jgi:hypothetical protein
VTCPHLNCFLIQTGANFEYILWKHCQSSHTCQISILNKKSNCKTILIKIVQSVQSPPKNKGIVLFVVYSFEFQGIGSTKTVISLYFWANFTNLHTILTSIASQFIIFVQNWYQTTAARLASFSKKEIIISSCLILFYRIAMICTSFWLILSQEPQHTF